MPAGQLRGNWDVLLIAVASCHGGQPVSAYDGNPGQSQDLVLRRLHPCTKNDIP